MVFQESLKVINKNNVSSIKSFDLCCHSATFLSSLFEMSKCPALHFSIFFYVRHTAPHLPTFQVSNLRSCRGTAKRRILSCRQGKLISRAIVSCIKQSACTHSRYFRDLVSRVEFRHTLFVKKSSTHPTQLFRPPLSARSVFFAGIRLIKIL